MLHEYYRVRRTSGHSGLRERESFASVCGYCASQHGQAQARALFKSLWRPEHLHRDYLHRASTFGESRCAAIRCPFSDSILRAPHGGTRRHGAKGRRGPGPLCRKKIRLRARGGGCKSYNHQRAHAGGRRAFIPPCRLRRLPDSDGAERVRGEGRAKRRGGADALRQPAARPPAAAAGRRA